MKPDWRDARAPDLDDFEVLAKDAFAALPEEFRRLCGDMTIRIAEFADDDVLKELEIESPFDLMGLFEGIGVHQQGEVATGRTPNMVTLYRRAILDHWAEEDETLGHLIAHVLIHEIGHHFGFSDEDMERIENDS